MKYLKQILFFIKCYFGIIKPIKVTTFTKENDTFDLEKHFNLIYQSSISEYFVKTNSIRQEYWGIRPDLFFEKPISLDNFTMILQIPFGTMQRGKYSLNEFSGGYPKENTIYADWEYDESHRMYNLKIFFRNPIPQNSEIVTKFLNLQIKGMISFTSEYYEPSIDGDNYAPGVIIAGASSIRDARRARMREYVKDRKLQIKIDQQTQYDLNDGKYQIVGKRNPFTGKEEPV